MFKMTWMPLRKKVKKNYPREFQRLGVVVLMGQNPVPPVNIPIPSKIDQNGWCTYPKMVLLVLAHSHFTKPWSKVKKGLEGTPQYWN